MLQLGLAGLTYAVVHGTAVMLILGHQPGTHTDPDPHLDALQMRYQDVRLPIPVNERQSAQDLGIAGDEPLMRVRIQAEDRPGTLLDVLRSLNDALRDTMPTRSPECVVFAAGLVVSHDRAVPRAT